jgi:site-specific recombinase XerD
MLERFYTYDYVLGRLRGSSLGDIFDDIAAYLHERGHTPKVAQAYLCGAGHFAHWLDREGLSPKAVSEATLASFMDSHLAGCRCRIPHGSPRHLRPALGHVLAVLRARGWAAPPSLPAQKPVDRLLHAFTVYLQETRGAAATTCRRNAEYARRFLEPRYGAAAVTLQDLGPAELLRFVLEQTRECAPGTAGLIRSALRSFLRFAHVHGLCDGSLAAAIPKVACWRQAPLPRSLSNGQLAALLRSFDVQSATGRRDHAMVMCMAGLGLRAGDVAALSLDDLDWQAGTLRVGRGKERRASLLPLTTPVGRALVGYLRHGRPRTPERRVFVRHQLPVGQPLTSQAVSAAVRQAFLRARLDVPAKGAHVLRHTAATHMVRAGASLKEVADILRHRSLETTMIYTKVDLPTLAAVALPWPEVRS